MDIKRIDHLALICSDSGQSRDWYCDVLGMEWILRGEWDNNPYFLRLGETCLALFQAGEKSTADPAPSGIRIDHFAFLAETRKAFADAQAELTARGIDFEPQNHGVSHSIYFPDPDGHKVEITTYDV